jgi:hypothetical protein
MKKLAKSFLSLTMFFILTGMLTPLQVARSMNVLARKKTFRRAYFMGDITL